MVSIGLEGVKAEDFRAKGKRSRSHLESLVMACTK